jgi:hypothetical protein
MTPRTLVDIFRNLANTPKRDLLLSKQGGKWILSCIRKHSTTLTP